MNCLKNKKGYTLTYAILVIGLLLILISSITMITFYNYKISKFGGQLNTSFYASDGALEEALTELSRFTYNAEVSAWEEVNNQVYLSDQIWISFLEDVYNDVDSSVLTVDEGNQIISRAVQGIFETSFYNNLLTVNGGGTPTVHNFYNDALVGKAKYLDVAGYSGVLFNSDVVLKSNILMAINTTTFSPSNIVSPSEEDGELNPAAIKVVTVSDPAISGEVRLAIMSDGTYHEFNKKIAVDVSILPPVYSFSTSMKTESIDLRKNQLTDQVLAAKGDIYLQEGNIEITGNVYGYGNNIDFKYDQDRDNYGGIIIGDGSTGLTVTIDGDIASRNSVKILSPNTDLNISQGLYSNSLFIHENADNSTIDVDENIYLYSDLFISGDNTDITIATSNPDAVGGTDPRTLLDADQYIPSVGNLVGLLSLHPIAGEGYTRTGSIIISEAANAPSITLNGLFLNGIVRYDLSEKDRFNVPGDEVAYKTGESFTTNNNKTYYQTLAFGSIYNSGVIAYLEDYIINTAISKDDPDNIAALVSFNDALNASLDQKEFRAIHYYTLGYEAFSERNQASPPDIFSLKDISAVDKSIIKLRNPLRTADTKAFYGINSNGLVQFKDAATNSNDGKIYHPDIININAISNNRNVLSRTIDEKANILGYANYTDLLHNNYSEVDLMNNWLDLSVDSEIPSDMATTKLSVYNNDPNRDIYINYDTIQVGGLNFTGQINFANEVFEGTVVSKGNVYIYASDAVTFIGNIISEKSIYVVGNGTKTLIHDDLAIYSAINKSDLLKQLYHTDTGVLLGVHGSMANDSLTLSLNPNPEKIDINSVNDMVTGGTTIVESKSLHINSWLEED